MTDIRHMRKWLLAMAVALWFSAGLAWGQTGQTTFPASITAGGASCTPTTCAELVLPEGSGSVAVTLCGTSEASCASYTATMQFEYTANNNRWEAAPGIPAAGGAEVTSATAVGTWRFNIAGMTRFRVRASAFTSGPVVVRINPSPATANRFGSISGGTITASNINNVRYCNQFAGADAGAKIAACIADLPATGGIPDARGLEGSPSGTAPITISKPVHMYWPSGNYTYSGTGQAIQVTAAAGNGVVIEGTGACDAGAPSRPSTITVTGTGVNGIDILNNSSVHLKDICIVGPDSGTGKGIIVSGNGFFLENTQTRGFGGHGTEVDGTRANSNSGVLLRARSYSNGGCGFNVFGADSNNLTFNNTDAQSNTDKEYCLTTSGANNFVGAHAGPGSDKTSVSFVSSDRNWGSIYIEPVSPYAANAVTFDANSDYNNLDLLNGWKVSDAGKGNQWQQPADGTSTTSSGLRQMSTASTDPGLSVYERIFRGNAVTADTLEKGIFFKSASSVSGPTWTTRTSLNFIYNTLGTTYGFRIYNNATGDITAITPVFSLDGSGNALFTGTITGTLIGNASTATALAADPANCAANQAAGGINASGTAESCLAVATMPAGAGLLKSDGGSPPTLSAVGAPTGEVVGTSDSQELTEKTLTAPVLTAYTVGTLPGTPATGEFVVVTDGANASDCVTGSGSSVVFCRYNGAAWAPIAGITTSATLLGALSDETGTGVAVFGTSPTIATPNLTGKLDVNNVAVDDDDCTGEQGLFWYDSTDSRFEFCNANSGAPTVLGGGGGAYAFVASMIDTVAGSTTEYAGISTGSFGLETQRTWINPAACTATDLYFELGSAQPADGSLVITLRDDGAGSTLTLTVPANSAAGVYSTTGGSAAIAVGSKLALEVVNNSASPSAAIRGWGINCNL